MAEPFLAEIRLFGFNFPPRNWATCDGQLLQISQNQALFSLLGTNYGGDGRVTFALPDLRGRQAIHVGPGYVLGQKSGVESVQLGLDEMPEHTHALQASSDNAGAFAGAGNVLARSTTPLYAAPANLEPLNAAATPPAGGGQGHPNMMPFLTLNFCIALVGTFPPRN